MQLADFSIWIMGPFGTIVDAIWSKILHMGKDPIA